MTGHPIEDAPKNGNFIGSAFFLNTNVMSTNIAILFPLAYMCACTFYGLFKIKIIGLYSLLAVAKEYSSFTTFADLPSEIFGIFGAVLSVILVLTMSALGGSMVPRYVMSPRMRELGQWTFNAWALDGYDKVFWRDLPVESLWPQLSVLLLAGVGFLVLARALAIRWETD